MYIGACQTQTACGRWKGLWYPEDCVLKCESLNEMYTVGTHLEYEPAERHERGKVLWL
jgi:hypothetical protein